jgi:hypothetical protein
MKHWRVIIGDVRSPRTDSDDQVKQVDQGSDFTMISKKAKSIG